MKASSEDMFKSTVLGHPQGLFILFFTEMWERFSYYGMRALLVLFLVSAMGMGGWDWTTEQALALYGTYTSMVYLTPILGGYLADRYIGYRRAVVIGAVVMTLGHVAMAIEFSHAFLYIGIGLLIIGNGFFKPNITSIISHMYKDTPEKKDGAYTIFYMGVNAGAFLGIMLCGYLGETLGWSYGFGLAGIFMLLGMFQFYFAQKIFGDIGTKPNQQEIASPKLEFATDRFNPFTKIDMLLVCLSAFGGLVWIINNPLTKIAGINVLKFGKYDGANATILVSVVLFFLLIVSRLIRYPKITRERMIAIVLFAVFTIIFWAAFEQAGGSMTIFAKDYTTRVLSGSSATIFNVVNIIITVVPIGIISWVLFMLFRKTFKRFTLSSIFLGGSFVIIWCIVGWMINRNLNSKAYIVSYDQVQTISKDKKTGEEVKSLAIVNAATRTGGGAVLVKGSMTIRESKDFKIGQKVLLIDTDKEGSLKYMDEAKSGKVEDVRRVSGTVMELKDKEVEIPASWFGILNSLFIIAFAPLFSKWWESRLNPSGASKYGIGLILLGIGFGALALGSMGIVKGQTGITVSMIWLIVAYLFHTLGELCLSPVALSYISKLVPGRMIALMFGVWYIAIAIGNKLAGEMGGQIDKIQEAHSMSFFFMIFTLVPVGIGLAAILLNPLMKRLMHGVK